MINNFQQAVAYKLETSEKIDLTKKKERKEDSNRNFRSEKCNN